MSKKIEEIIVIEKREVKIIKISGEKLIKVIVGVPQRLVLDPVIGCYFLVE